MHTHSAREWLEHADFSAPPRHEIRQQFVAKVGADKADEVQAAMRRIAENLLDTLGELQMTERTFHTLLNLVTLLAVENYLDLHQS